MLVAAPANNPLTGRFENAPETHDGDPFTVELHFSENIAMTWKSMRDDVPEMTGATVTKVRRLTQGSNRGWELTVTPASRDATVGIGIAPGRACGETGAVCTQDGRGLSNAPGASIPASATVTAGTALTARFANVPSEHDGTNPFTLELHFSEETGVQSDRTLRDSVLDVKGGTVTGARRVTEGDNRSWAITVTPDSWARVRVAVPPTTDCGATGAVCTADGRMLSNAPTVRIKGPPALSVADAEVEEGPGAVLAFAVTLNRAASGTVTVGYGTVDATADYVAASGTLVFAPGETEKTVNVAVLDDSHDEGQEVMLLYLWNPSGARLADGAATGTIENTDVMPAAWLARFGRTVAEQVVDSVQARLGGARRPGAEATLAWQRIGLGDGSGDGPGNGASGEAAVEDEAQARLESLTRWLRDEDDAERRRALGSRTVTARELLTGSSFALAAGTEAGGIAGLWGRGAVSRFSGRAGEVSLDGEVAAGMLGADWTRGPWTRHAPESSPIRVTAAREGVDVAISVAMLSKSAWKWRTDGGAQMERHRCASNCPARAATISGTSDSPT